MRISARLFQAVLPFMFLLLFVFTFSASAETIEVVTYYPAPGNGGGPDPQMNSLRVGNGYQNTTAPLDGIANIFNALTIGVPAPGGGARITPAGALEVRGAPDALDRVLFLPGADTAAAGTPEIRVGIGTAAPTQQLEITGNFRLPPTTATAGIIFSGPDRLIHTFGNQNFFAGTDAGNFTMTGTGNIGIGVFAFLANAGGSNNTAIGLGALRSNNTGSSNTAVGMEALPANTLGGGNTATGSGALYFNTIGNANVAIGNNALRSNTSGTGNIALGYNAGYGSTPFTGANTTGSSNTFIGFNTSFGTATQLTNATAIGANAVVSASNALVLGGTGINAVNVGIAMAVPQTTSPRNNVNSGNLDANDVFIRSANLWLSQKVSMITGTYVGNGGAGRRTVAVPGISATRPIRFLMIFEPQPSNASVTIKTETMPGQNSYKNADASAYGTANGAVAFESSGFSFDRDKNGVNRNGDTFPYVALTN